MRKIALSALLMAVLSVFSVAAAMPTYRVRTPHAGKVTEFMTRLELGLSLPAGALKYTTPLSMPVAKNEFATETLGTSPLAAEDRACARLACAWRTSVGMLAPRTVRAMPDGTKHPSAMPAPLPSVSPAS